MTIKSRIQKTVVAVAALGAMSLIGSAYAHCGTCGTGDSHDKTAAADHSHDKKNIVETAVAAGEFTTLASLLTKTGLAETLSGEGPYTVFAPTDKAFAKIPEEKLNAIANDEELLKRVLLYHVAKGKVKSGQVSEMPKVRTLNGQFVEVKAWDGKVKIGDAKVTTADIYASNGVIHVIDTVLVPGPAADKDIVETAVGAGQFNTLATLLTQAGLVDALKGEGPYTVFAPTDAAFAKVPEATLQSLAANPEQLKKVLLYHVVSGDVSSLDVKDAGSAKTLEGSKVDFKVADGKVNVNKANIVSADILAENGIIHVIDEVILPKM